jgi:uncharacterized membrane protein
VFVTVVDQADVHVPKRLESEQQQQQLCYKAHSRSFIVQDTQHLLLPLTWPVLLPVLLLLLVVVVVVVVLLLLLLLVVCAGRLERSGVAVPV